MFPEIKGDWVYFTLAFLIPLAAYGFQQAIKSWWRRR